MKNFKFLLKDVYLLKLYSDKDCIDCFAMKISDTINSYNSHDNYSFNTLNSIHNPFSRTFEGTKHNKNLNFIG